MSEQSADLTHAVRCQHCDHGEVTSAGLCVRCGKFYRTHKLVAQECLDQYGNHVDDGGFLIGACARCGHIDDCGDAGVF